MDLKNSLIELARLFEKEKVDYALCGGLALAVHGYPRATRDLDLLIGAEDLLKVRGFIKQNGYTLEGGMFVFREGTERETKLWRVSKREGNDLLTVDFILAENWLSEVFQGRLCLSLEGNSLNVVSREGLRMMKKASARAQDLADLEKLDGYHE